MSAYISS